MEALMTVINKTQKINSMMDEVAAKSAEDFIEKLDKQLGDLYQLLNDAKETFSTSGANAFLYFGLNVKDSAPKDFPWYEPFIATIPFLPVNFLANLIAASIASAPLLFK